MVKSVGFWLLILMVFAVASIACYWTLLLFMGRGQFVEGGAVLLGFIAAMLVKHAIRR